MKRKLGTGAEMLISMAGAFTKYDGYYHNDYSQWSPKMVEKDVSYLSSEDIKERKYVLLSVQRFNYSPFTFFKSVRVPQCHYQPRCPCCSGEKRFPLSFSTAQLECQEAPLTGHWLVPQRLVKPVLVINHQEPEMAVARMEFINWPVIICPHVRKVRAILVVSHASILVTEGTLSGH